jgi:hypothetical protein
MAFSVEMLGSKELKAALRQAPKHIHDALANESVIRVNRIQATASARASQLGTLQAKAGATIHAQRINDGGEVSGGGGAGLGSIVFMGSEFGGRRKLKSYATRSRSGKAYIARRHTTRQFKLHLGTRGYFFWPAVRKELRGFSDTCARLIEENVIRG